MLDSVNHNVHLLMKDFFTRHLSIPKDKPVLMLAPMEGITNSHFRESILSVGAPHVVATEFIRITGVKQRVNPFVRHSCPLQIQIMGCSPEVIAGNLAFLKEREVIFEHDWIDLNVGCPSKRVNAHGSGAALLKEPEKLLSIINHLRSEHAGSLSIKTRIGYDSAENFPAVLHILKEAPIDFISIHARTKQQAYQPGIHHEQLALAVETLPFPVIGNGDVWDIKRAEEMLDRTGVRGLMIGRGAIRDPFIFAKLKAHFYADSGRLEPLAQEYLSFARELLARYMEAGACVGKPQKYLGAFKEFAAWLTKNPALSRSFFDGMKRLQSFQEVRQYIECLIEPESVPICSPVSRLQDFA